jgi:hypothetical protein
MDVGCRLGVERMVAMRHCGMAGCGDPKRRRSNPVVEGLELEQCLGCVASS